MKKYTIKEFAKGQKAVKIKNKEQWDKLNKVHKLCDFLEDLSNVYYTNQDSWERQVYLSNTGWELLEFSQLDFDNEFVVGKWYQPKQISKLFINPSRKEVIWSDGTFEENHTSNDFVKNWIMLEDFSEIQQYLPKNHPDLIKKDTFVLPEKWCIRQNTSKEVCDWFNKAYHINSFIGGAYDYLVNWKQPEREHYSFEIPENTTEITFEQFKTYILKEKTMKKEIIGYKLKFDEYKKAALKICNTVSNWENSLAEYDISIKQTQYINELKEAGVLDLWFELVFAPKFKVGEWVTWVQTPMVTGKIVRYNNDACYALDIKGNLVSHNSCHKQYLRLATEEEIKKAQNQLPVINGYEGSYSNGVIKYGCAEFTKEFFINLQDLENDVKNRPIKSIELSSGVKITFEEIEQIVEYINKK